MNTCQTCRFFNVVYEHQTAVGQCRRRAPIIGGEFGMTAWPKVTPGDWCGDFGIKLEVAQRERLESSFWFNTICQICGVVNDKAEDSSKGWRFYSTPGQPMLYTCGKCPVLPGAKEGYEH